MPRRKEEMSFGDIGEMMRDGLNRAVTRPTIHGYVPHDKQVRFHSTPERGRLYIGGNRSGKTVGGVVEDIFWLRGEHPYRSLQPAPVRGRIVTVSYIEGIQKIIIPEISKWLPPSDLINGSWEDSYSKSERTLTLTNGSTVELMSYDQKLEKFAGTSRHFTHFDEEPPKAIFDECRMRLLDTAGSWWMTMTPVEGMTWVHDDLYLPGLKPGGNVAVIIIDTAENPYVSDAEIEIVLEGLDAGERAARKSGKFVQLGGLAFKKFNVDIHVIPAITDEQLQQIMTWTQYASLDHGLNNPTAWLWHAVSPKGAVISFDEIYGSERLVSDFAREIHGRNKLPGRRSPEIYVGDPAISQRNAQTGDSIQTAYANEGIPIVLGNNDVKIGVEKMNRYFSQGKWVITENCHNLIRELQRVRWKTYESAKKRHDNNLREELHKKDDHAPDSARYFFSMMPDLYIPPAGSPSPEGLTANQIIQQTLGATTPPVGAVYDTNLAHRRQSTEWSQVDEHLGGYW